MAKKDTKAMTVRLPSEQHAELEAIAEVDEVPVSEAVRDAIERHIRAKRGDKQFRERLRRRMEQQPGDPGAPGAVAVGPPVALP